MKALTKLSIPAVCVLVTMLAPSAEALSIKGSELFGFRIGGVRSTGTMEDVFGSGTEMELHFTEGLGTWFGIDIALSAHNFGDSKDAQKNIDYTGLNMPVELGIYSVTAAFLAAGSLSERFALTGEAGAGLYVVNTSITAGLYEGNRNENRFGMYGGAGILFRLTKSLHLDLNGKYHYIFSGSDRFDSIYFYTDRSRTQFLQISFGVLILVGS
jgi:opacity protein-like surface antigen